MAVEYTPSSVAHANARLGEKLVVQGTLESAPVSSSSLMYAMHGTVLNPVWAATLPAVEMFRHGGIEAGHPG